MIDQYIKTEQVIKHRPMWTLTSALAFQQTVESELTDLGYHCGLSGGVLTKGYSDKDLDLILYPHKTQNAIDIKEVLNHLLVSFQLVSLELRDHSHYSDGKLVYCAYTVNNQRIDFFCLK